MSAALKASNLAGLDSRKHQPAFLLSGIVLMLCGIFAILTPVVSTLAATLTFGAITVVAGLAQIVQAFRSAAWKGLFLNLIIGLAFLLVGAAFLIWPPKGAIALTATLAWLLLVAGFGEIALGFRIRGARGWPWLILSGLVAIVGGLWLMLRIPFTGFFVPGIALGIALISEGIAFIAIALDRRGPAAEAAEEIPADDRPDL